MPKVKFTAAEIKLLLLLAGIQFSHIVEYMVFMPLGPQLMRLLKIQADQFSLLVSSYDFCAGVTGLISAFFLDRYDRKKSLLFCLSCFAVGTLACALVSSYQALLVARMFTGAFGGVLGSLVFAIAGDAVALERRGAATGIIMGGLALAMVIGVPFSLYLANWSSWQLPLFVLSCLGFMIGLFLFWGLPSQRMHLQEKNIDPWLFIRSIPQLKRPRVALLLQGCLVLGQFSVIPFLGSFLVMNVGIQESELPLIYLVGGIVSLLSSPLFGVWSDRQGPVKVLMWTASFSLIPLVAVTHLPALPLWLCLSGSIIFFISMAGRLVPLTALATGSVLPQHRGTFMSLSNAVQQFAGALSVWITGQIVTNSLSGQLQNFHWVGYFSAFFTLLAVLLAYQLRFEPAQVSESSRIPEEKSA